MEVEADQKEVDGTNQGSSSSNKAKRCVWQGAVWHPLCGEPCLVWDQARWRKSVGRCEEGRSSGLERH